jgi:hypothetical protein
VSGRSVPDLGSTKEDQMRKAIISTVLALATLPAFAGSSWAAPVTPVPLQVPAQVVVSGPTAVLSTSIYSTATRAGTPHCVAVSAPVGAARAQVRLSVVCGYANPLRVTVKVRSALLSSGAQTWMVRDLADNSLRALPVTVRSVSRFDWGTLLPIETGLVYVDAQVSHYRQGPGWWAGSSLSPVWVQVLKGGAWVTVGSVTSNATGHAVGLVAVPAGRFTFRLYRPQGATVLATATPARVLDPGVVWDY